MVISQENPDSCQRKGRQAVWIRGWILRGEARCVNGIIISSDHPFSRTKALTAGIYQRIKILTG